MFPIARYWLRRRSTHFLLAASAIGWAGVILVPNHIQAGETCFAYSSISGLRGAPSWDSLLFSNSAAGLLFGWLWMVLAMAPPLLGTQVEHVWHGTLSRNRFLALTLFFAGYTTASLPAGFVLNAVALILLFLAGGSFLIAISFATLLVGIFELTAAKRRGWHRVIGETTGGVRRKVCCRDRRVWSAVCPGMFCILLGLHAPRHTRRELACGRDGIDHNGGAV
ncbi:hypothetical protein AJ87_07040 [Rhizobium yanglingense]|nr:hypothetical protein AJ87_07040 [Rhizobium yanglingense]